MATANDFRRIVLGLNGTLERSHMNHPDFRVGGKIFASLHHDDKFGMVKLPLDEQARLMRDYPDMFSPEAGAWGRQGCTRVHLAHADEETLGEAITLAWQDMIANTAAKKPARAKKPAARKTAKTSTRKTAPKARR